MIRVRFPADAILFSNFQFNLVNILFTQCLALFEKRLTLIHQTESKDAFHLIFRAPWKKMELELLSEKACDTIWWTTLLLALYLTSILQALRTFLGFAKFSNFFHFERKDEFELWFQSKVEIWLSGKVFSSFQLWKNWTYMFTAPWHRVPQQF